MCGWVGRRSQAAKGTPERAEQGSTRPDADRGRPSRDVGRTARGAAVRPGRRPAAPWVLRPGLQLRRGLPRDAGAGPEPTAAASTSTRSTASRRWSRTCTRPCSGITGTDDLAAGPGSSQCSHRSRPRCSSRSRPAAGSRGDTPPSPPASPTSSRPAAFPPADAQAANFEIFMLPLMTVAFVLAVRRTTGRGRRRRSRSPRSPSRPLPSRSLPLAYVAWRDPSRARSRAPGRGVRRSDRRRRRRVRTARLRALGVHGQRRLRRRERRDRIRLLERARTRRAGSSSAARRSSCSCPGRGDTACQDLDLWLWLALRGGGRAHRLPLLPALLPAAPAAARAARDAGARLARRRATGGACCPVVAVVAVVSTTLWFVVPAFTNGDNRDTKVALDVATYVAHHTAPGAAVLVWGQAPEVYWSSGAPPGDTLRDDRVHHRRLGWATTEPRRDAVRGARAPPISSTETSADSPPVLIADMSTADQRHAHFAPPSRFPRFAAFPAPQRLAPCRPRRRCHDPPPVWPDAPERDPIGRQRTRRRDMVLDVRRAAAGRSWSLPFGGLLLRELRRNRELADRCLPDPTGSGVLRQLHARCVPRWNGTVRRRLRPRRPHQRESPRRRSEWSHHGRRAAQPRRSRATPCSATPTSQAPTSATPTSPAPTSPAPISLEPG